MGGDGSFSFGMPGRASDAGREISIKQLDPFRFDPADLRVAMDETVTFEVTNQGATTHEFVLGDDAWQEDHEQEMADMGGAMMRDGPNTLTVKPGETKTLTWTFTDPGSLKYGCHVSGHYAGGMLGTVTVSE